MVTISLKQAPTGSWSICRCRIALFSNLPLGPAITLAREMARDEHERMGRSVCVEMPGPASTIVLARYLAGEGAPADSTLAA